MPDLPSDARPHVVIIGGGFGGLTAARALADVPVRITLVDRRNHHLFQALLYQVATAALNPSDIAYPIRRVFRHQRNTTVLMAEVTGIDVAARVVTLADGTLSYDHLIVASGATHSYFGRDDWAPVAPGLKSVEDALLIRSRILLAFERAERMEAGEARNAQLTFAVVGGGPTGVELAGALGEVARYAMARDFRNIDPTQARVLLLEGSDRILNMMPPELSEQAVVQLQRLGVEVRTGARVTQIDADGVLLGTERIRAATVLWAAGVQASPLGKSLGVPLDRAGRVRVNADLSLPGHPEVQVIGDLAAFEQDGKPCSGVAPFAIQAGHHAAQTIRRRLGGATAALPFRYLDQGALATIGRAAAVAMLGKRRLTGYPAWLAWLVIHIYKLIGFRNRMLVMLQWAWAYVSWERGARLITGPAPAPSTATPDAAPPSPGSPPETRRSPPDGQR